MFRKVVMAYLWRSTIGADTSIADIKHAHEARKQQHQTGQETPQHPLFYHFLHSPTELTHWNSWTSPTYHMQHHISYDSSSTSVSQGVHLTPAGWSKPKARLPRNDDGCQQYENRTGSTLLERAFNTRDTAVIISHRYPIRAGLAAGLSFA